MAYLPGLTMSSLPAFSMASLPTLLTTFVATSLSYGAYKLLLFLYSQWTSPLHVLPGPPNVSLILGHVKAIMKAVCVSGLFDLLLSLIQTSLQENSVLHEKWVNEYGSTLTYNVLFGVRFIGNIYSDFLAYPRLCSR